MKQPQRNSRLLPFLILFAAACAALAQNTVVNFSNLDLAHGVNAPFFDVDGTNRLAGDNYRAALYYGPPGTAEANFLQISQAQPFRTGNFAGYWVPASVFIPGPAPGSTILAQVRFWDTLGGALTTFEQAQAAGAPVGFSIVLQLVLSTSGSTPLSGLRSASLIPAVPLLAPAETRTIADAMAVPNGLTLGVLCSRTVGQLRWINLTCLAAGEAVIRTDGSAIDTVLAVYTNCLLSADACGLVACNDDRSQGQSASEVRFHAEPNIHYAVAVGGADGATGALQITFSLTVALAATPMQDGTIEFSWPVEANGFDLETTTNLAQPLLWEPVAGTPIVVGGRNTVRRNAESPFAFYRLKRNSSP